MTTSTAVIPLSPFGRGFGSGVFLGSDMAISLLSQGDLEPSLRHPLAIGEKGYLIPTVDGKRASIDREGQLTSSELVGETELKLAGVDLFANVQALNDNSYYSVSRAICQGDINIERGRSGE